MPGPPRATRRPASRRHRCLAARRTAHRPGGGPPVPSPASGDTAAACGGRRNTGLPAAPRAGGRARRRCGEGPRGRGGRADGLHGDPSDDEGCCIGRTRGRAVGQTAVPDRARCPRLVVVCALPRAGATQTRRVTHQVAGDRPGSGPLATGTRARPQAPYQGSVRHLVRQPGRSRVSRGSAILPLGCGSTRSRTKSASPGACQVVRQPTYIEVSATRAGRATHRRMRRARSWAAPQGGTMDRGAGWWRPYRRGTVSMWVSSGARPSAAACAARANSRLPTVPVPGG